MVVRRARKAAAVVVGVGLALGLVAPAAAIPLEGLSAGHSRLGPVAVPASQAAADESLPEDWMLPACFGPPETTTLDPAAEWDSIVLDPVRGLPSGWAPDDLVEVPSLGTQTNAEVRAFVLDPLLAMHAAAVAADAPFDVVSGFRSHGHQDWIHDHSTQEPTAPDEPMMVAPPGHSEHQLGTAVDLVDPSDISLTAAFADTPAGAWVAEHAPDFGFVVSYPEGAQAQSCYGWEPWHLRYVGPERAHEMTAAGLAPRAFLLRESAITQS